MIESYRFGKIKIDGVDYKRDLIIFPDHIDDDWWREESHRLKPQDLKSVIKHKPDIIVVGKGAFSRMKVTEKTKQVLEEEGIELIAKRTDKAKDVYNKLLDQDKTVVAALHLTC